MNHDPYKWGRPSDATYGQYNYDIANAQAIDHHNNDFPKKHTQNPIITGTSVIALKYKDGIIMAADNMGSYGSLMRFNDIERLIRVGDQTVVGISGDISDLQHIERILDELVVEEDIYDNEGGDKLRAPHIHEYLTRVLYNRRSKMNPLWNSVLVGGFNDDNTPFLKYVDLLGVAYGSSTLATGFGSHLAIPLLRNLIPYDKDYANIDEQEAKKVIHDSMRVLFYRDARSMDKFSLVTIKSQDSQLKYEYEKDVKIENQSWRFAKDIIGYGSKQQ